MEVIPTSLDFGLVVPGEEVVRTVMLKEVPTDRFTISKIDFGQLPLTFAKQEEITLDGLKFYRTELTFALVDDKIEGKQSETVEFATDSKQFPNVRIPVIYEVASIIQTKPRVVSFGTVKVGEKAHEDIEFSTRSGRPVVAFVESLPNEVSFECRGGAYQVSFAPQTTGVWSGKICLNFDIAGVRTPCAIKCVAYVTK